MDELKTIGLSSSGIAIILFIYRLLKSVQGKRLVSSCCGKKIEVSMDIEEITPKKQLVSVSSSETHQAVAYENPLLHLPQKPLPSQPSNHLTRETGVNNETEFDSQPNGLPSPSPNYQPLHLKVSIPSLQSQQTV